jgi:hypothetical protein
MPTKYEPLGIYLLDLPTTANEVLLTFKQVEKIIGASLPMSARTYREWWSNEGANTTHSQAKAWFNAGFVVDSVHQDGDNARVEFKRR